MAPPPYTASAKKGTASKAGTDGKVATTAASTATTTIPAVGSEDGIPAQPAGFIYPIPKRNHAAYPHPLLSHAHGIITAWWLFSVLLVASLLTNILQLLSHTLLFLPPTTRLSLAQHLANAFWLLFPFATEVHSSIPLLLTGGAPVEGDGGALLIGNHAPGLDFPVGCSVSFLPGGPGVGRLLVLMKQSLSFYPIVGWTHVLQGSLFLTRRWESDKRQIDNKMSEILDPAFPRPFWIGVYPEGTRITPDKKAASQSFSSQPQPAAVPPRAVPTHERVYVRVECVATYVGGCVQCDDELQWWGVVRVGRAVPWCVSLYRHPRPPHTHARRPAARRCGRTERVVVQRIQ